MIGRILAAYSVEFANAIRLRSTYLGPAMVGLTIVLLTFQYPIARDANSSSDYSFIAVAMPAALDLVGVFMLLFYCSTLISIDMGSGMIRLVLVRPLRRREYLAAKVLMGWTYALILIAVAAVLSTFLAFMFGELTGIYYGDTVVYTGAEMRRSLVLAIALNILPLFATVSFALLMSTLSRSRTVALAAVFIVWVALDLVKQPLGAELYFFTTHLEHSWEVFSDRCNALPAEWNPEAAWAAAVSGTWIAGCTLLSLLALGSRDFSR